MRLTTGVYGIRIFKYMYLNTTKYLGIHVLLNFVFYLYRPQIEPHVFPFTNFIWTACPASVGFQTLPVRRPKCSHTIHILLVFGLGSSSGWSTVLIVVNWQVWENIHLADMALRVNIILQYKLNTIIWYWRCWILYLDNEFHTSVTTCTNIGIPFSPTVVTKRLVIHMVAGSRQLPDWYKWWKWPSDKFSQGFQEAKCLVNS